MVLFGGENDLRKKGYDSSNGPPPATPRLGGALCTYALAALSQLLHHFDSLLSEQRQSQHLLLSLYWRPIRQPLGHGRSLKRAALSWCFDLQAIRT